MEDCNGFDLDIKRKKVSASDNRQTAESASTIIITIGMTTSDNCSAPTCTCYGSDTNRFARSVSSDYRKRKKQSRYNN